MARIKQKTAHFACEAAQLSPHGKRGKMIRRATANRTPRHGFRSS